MILLLEALHHVNSVIPACSSSLIEKSLCLNPPSACWFNECENCKDAATVYSKVNFLPHFLISIVVMQVLMDLTPWYQWEDSKNSFGTTFLTA